MQKTNTKSFSDVMQELGTTPNFIISPGCKTENQGFFTMFRVDRSTVPEGWYAYDLRENSNGNLCSIEPLVVANHGGTFLTQTPVKMNGKNFRSFTGKGHYTFV